MTVHASLGFENQLRLGEHLKGSPPQRAAEGLGQWRASGDEGTALRGPRGLCVPAALRPGLRLRGRVWGAACGGSRGLRPGSCAGAYVFCPSPIPTS